MSVDRFDYGAVSIAGRNVGRPIGGEIIFDETWAPHVQATIDLPYTAEAYTRCDPRQTSRNVTFLLSRYPAGQPVQTKGFNLTLTGRSVDRAREVITITAASMEARLQESRNVTTNPDETLLQWQTSDTLAAGVIALKGVGDTYFFEDWSRPLPVQVDSQNLIPNPSAEVDLSSVLGTRCTVTRQTTTSSAAFGGALFRLDAPVNNDSFMTVGFEADTISDGMSAGGTYTASGTVRVDSALPGAGSRARKIVVFHRSGNGPFTEAASEQGPATGVGRVSVTFTLPENTKEAFVRFYHGHTSGVVFWDGLSLVEHVPGDVTEGGYWDGDSSDTSDYSYSWDDAAGVSTSTRIALRERTPDAFIIDPGESYWDKVSTLLASVGLRLFDPGHRRWKLADDSFVADGGIHLSWNNIIEWGARLDLADEDDEWCDAAVVRYYWRDWRGVDRERFDTFGPSSAKKVRMLEINSPFPGKGLAQNIVRRAGGYADSVVLEAVADLTVIPTQPITISQQDGSLLSALVRRVRFDFETDTMTIETRGVTTPPASAWILLPSGDEWTDSPVGATWTGEVIG